MKQRLEGDYGRKGVSVNRSVKAVYLKPMWDAFTRISINSLPALDQNGFLPDIDSCFLESLIPLLNDNTALKLL